MNIYHKINTDLYFKVELKNIINSFDERMWFVVDDTLGELQENSAVRVRYDISVKLQQYQF